MIEAAVASSLTASMVRPASGTVKSTAATVAPSASSAVAKSSSVGADAPYLSPYVRLSPGERPVWVVRDSSTGAQISQYPTPAQIKAYQSAQASQAQMLAQAAAASSDVASPVVPREVSYEQAKAVLESSVQFQEIKKEITAQAAKAAPAPVPTPVSTPAPVPVATPQPPVPVATPVHVSTEA